MVDREIGADVLRCAPEQIRGLVVTALAPRLRCWLEDLEWLADYLAENAEALRAGRKRLEGALSGPVRCSPPAGSANTI